MKRVLVVMTVETGDDITVSVKAKNRDLNADDKRKLQQEVSKKLLPYVDDALYFRIRYNEKVGKSKGIVESVKVRTISELNTEINNMFFKLGVE